MEGISSLANQEEVDQGLSQIRTDIDSGKINHIMDSYKNDWGDYMFIVGQKISDNKH